VAFGGSLDQHIPDHPGLRSHASAVFPKPEPGSIGPLQPVEIDPTCRLARALGATTTTGAHSHHQAVARVGEGLVAVGGELGPFGVEGGVPRLRIVRAGCRSIRA
jgi:gamma-glutamyl-gamma-aminobutyrate hydrolase PuuD